MRARRMGIVCLVLGSLSGCTAPAQAPPIMAMPADDTLLLDPPEQGVQLRFGPFNAPHGDTQLCRTLKLDNDEPLAINRFDLKMRLSSHHFIVFRARQKPDGSQYEYPDTVFDCFGTVNFDEWDFVLDVNKGGGADWQLEDGQAMVFPPHAQIMLQSHFSNGAPDPVRGEAVLNMHSIPRSEVKHELLGMFTVNTRIAIPKQTMGYQTTKRCSLSRSVHIVAMTGHFHSHGRMFLVEHMGPVEGMDYGPAYCSGPRCLDEEGSFSDWDHPMFKLFDYSRGGPLLINGSRDGEAEALRFTCEYDNDGDNVIGFGGMAQTQEHCNLFFQYYVDDPAVKEPLSCAEGAGGW